MHLADFVQQYYPEYWGIQRYPANQCAVLLRVRQEWGIFSNFAKTPITVNGITFKSTESLYQILKFKDKEAIKAIYAKAGQTLKMTAKHYEKIGRSRDDWGSWFIDAMKFCLVEKYKQSKDFRDELERSKKLELFIVEQQPNPRKSADAWSVKLSADGQTYEGPNITGRLLMELRDNNGQLNYKLPEDALDYIAVLK